MKKAAAKRYVLSFLAALVFFVQTANATPNSDRFYLLQTLTDAADRHHSSFGVSIAVSGDTIVVGDPGPNLSSGVSVYLRDGGLWASQQRIEDPWPSFCNGLFCFGYSVGIDGDTVAVGNPGAQRAWPFSRTGQFWTTQGLFEGFDIPGTIAFGSAVSVNGQRIAVGDPYAGAHDVYVPELGGEFTYATGSVAIYVRNNGSWSVEQVLVPGSESILLPSPIALTQDDLFIFRGDVYVYGRTNGAWTLQQQIPVQHDGSSNQFDSLAIDGDHLVVGAIDGPVQIFERSASGWNLQKSLFSSDTSNFGRSVAIKGDLIFVGAEGIVHKFTWTGVDWIEAQRLAQVNGFDPTFGTVVAAGDGFVVVGSSDAFNDFNYSDRVHIFGFDRFAPVISEPVIYGPVLWPPDHRMRDFELVYTTSDCCGTITESISVTSSEPVIGSGFGDSSPDWEIVDAHHFRLRAERSGLGDRFYTITITATDESGNSSERDVTVTVPHNVAN